MGLAGRPSLVSEADLTVLEELFVSAYNELINCPLSGTSLVLDNATIIYNGNTNQQSNTTDLPIQGITYLVVVQGRSCSFCGSSATVLLFQNASSSGFQNGTRLRELRVLSDFQDRTSRQRTSRANDFFWQSFASSYYHGSSQLHETQDRTLTGHFRNTRGRKKEADNHDNDSNLIGSHSMIKGEVESPPQAPDPNSHFSSDLRALQNTAVCGCKGPSQLDFTYRLSTVASNASAQNSSSTNGTGELNFNAISGVVGVTQLLPVEGCNPYNQSKFNVTGILSFAVAAGQSLTPTDLVAISKQIKQSYEAVNSLNSHLCDPYFRHVTHVQLQSGLNQRRLGSSVINTTPSGILYNEMSPEDSPSL